MCPMLTVKVQLITRRGQVMEQPPEGKRSHVLEYALIVFIVIVIVVVILAALGSAIGNVFSTTAYGML